jgi:hypothetical protein
MPSRTRGVARRPVMRGFGMIGWEDVALMMRAQCARRV